MSALAPAPAAPTAAETPAWPRREGALLPGATAPDWRRIEGMAETPVRDDVPQAEDLRAPRPVEPLGGAVVDSHALNLRWRAVPGADSYDVEVSPETDFSRHVLSVPGVPSVEMSLSGMLPPAGAQLAWRVRARRAGAASPWSAYGRFYAAGEADADLYNRELAAARATQARLDAEAQEAGDLEQIPIYERDAAADDALGLWVVYATVGLGVIGSVFILLASLLTL